MDHDSNSSGHTKKQDLIIPLYAFSDGERIGITTAMLGILKTDDELAFVLAHETAHNVLGHVDRKQANAAIGMLVGAIFDIGLAAGAGINTQGLGMRAGADAGALAYSKEFEFEADYTSNSNGRAKNPGKGRVQNGKAPRRCSFNSRGLFRWRHDHGMPLRNYTDPESKEGRLQG